MTIRVSGARSRAMRILTGLMAAAFGGAAVRLPERRRGHPRAAVRPVQPDLRHSEIVLGAELRQTEHNAYRIMERAA
jgi:hypothetical protein